MESKGAKVGSYKANNLLFPLQYADLLRTTRQPEFLLQQRYILLCSLLEAPFAPITSWLSLSLTWHLHPPSLPSHHSSPPSYADRLQLQLQLVFGFCLTRLVSLRVNWGIWVSRG